MNYPYNPGDNNYDANDKLPMPPAYYESEPPYKIYRPEPTAASGYYRQPYPITPPATYNYPYYAPPAQTHVVYHVVAPAFLCPFCHATYPPLAAQRISPGGWVTFWVLLVLFFPLCWIGLLMKENYFYCAHCRVKLN